MPNPIDIHPELAQIVGRVTGHWALVEMHAEMVFCTLLELPMQQSKAIFSFFRSVSTQRDATLRLAAIVLGDKSPAYKETKEAFKAFVDLASERNGLIHQPFGYDMEKTPRELYKMKRDFGRNTGAAAMPIDVKDIEALLAKVVTLRDRMAALQQTVFEARFPSWTGTDYAQRLRQSPGSSTENPLPALTPNEEQESPPEPSQA